MKARISSAYEILEERAPNVVAVIHERLDYRVIWEDGEEKREQFYRPREHDFQNRLLELGIRGIDELEAAIDDRGSRLFDPKIEVCFVVGEEFSRCVHLAVRVTKAIPRLAGSIYVEISRPLNFAEERTRVVRTLKSAGAEELIFRLIVLTKKVSAPLNPAFEGIGPDIAPPGSVVASRETAPKAVRSRARAKPAPKRTPKSPAPETLPTTPEMIPQCAPPWAEVFGEDDSGIFAECSVRGVAFVWRWIPPGTFRMGSRKGDRMADDYEKPRHSVTISRGFWLGETPVTQAQWKAITGDAPSHFEGGDRPVESVDWHQAMAFAKRLGKSVLGLHACLPTEAQWEYACRAGKDGDFFDGSACTLPEGKDPALDRLAWFGKNSGNETHPVKGKVPNAWGLYDLLGNVWEWCRDARSRYSRPAEIDPQAGDGSGERVIRGGSWLNEARGCRSACRAWALPGLQPRFLGLRLAAAQEFESAEPRGAERPAVRPAGRGWTAEDSGVGQDPEKATEVAEEAPWDRAAHRAVRDALERLEFDAEQRQISLPDADEPRRVSTAASREELEALLAAVAEHAAALHMWSGVTFLYDGKGVVEAEIGPDLSEKIDSFFSRFGPDRYDRKVRSEALG